MMNGKRKYNKYKEIVAILRQVLEVEEFSVAILFLAIVDFKSLHFLLDFLWVPEDILKIYPPELPDKLEN